MYLIKNMLIFVISILFFSCNLQSDNLEVDIPQDYYRLIQNRLYEPLIIEGKVEKGKIISGEYINDYFYSMPTDIYYDSLNRIIMGIAYYINDSNKLSENFRFKYEYYEKSSNIERIIYKNKLNTSVINFNRKPNGKIVEIVCDKNVEVFPKINDDGNFLNTIHYKNTKYIYNNLDSLIEKHSDNISTFYSYSNSNSNNTIVSYYVIDNSKNYIYFDNFNSYFKGLKEKGYYTICKINNNLENEFWENYSINETDTTKAILICTVNRKNEYDKNGKLAYQNKVVIDNKKSNSDYYWSYDKFGNKQSLKVISTSENGLQYIYEYSYIYKYDTNGEWTERYLVDSSLESILYVENRIIEYKN